MRNLYLLLLFVGVSASALKPPAPVDAIYYFSFNHAIRLGQYDGVTEAGKLRAYGNFGLGTEEQLAAELVMLDGNLFAIAADGKVKTMDDDARIAFSVVKDFVPDSMMHLNGGIKYAKLQQQLGAAMQKNTFTAIRIHGKFSTLVCRSFVKQEKPYKPLNKVPEKLFTYHNVRGTLVGFYTPSSSAVMNSPMYHFHFISDDRNAGGHVKDLVLDDAIAEIDYAQHLQVALPPPTATKNIDLKKMPKGEK